MFVEMIQGDIDRGIPESANECPVAWALRRAGFVSVDVLSDAVYMCDGCALGPGEPIPCYGMGLGLMDWIDGFDAFKTTRPIVDDYDPPSEPDFDVPHDRPEPIGLFVDRGEMVVRICSAYPQRVML